MRPLMLLLVLLLGPICAQEITFSYFDKGKYRENNIALGDFPEKIERQDIDAAYMITLSYPLNPAPSALALYAGSSIGRFDLQEHDLYAYSTYLSARLSPFSLLILKPFVEISFAGPTYLSKQNLGSVDFGSSIVYRHAISIGVKATAFVVDIKMLNYSTSLPTAFTKESITMPFILSVGVVY